jgi:hypothetical protein
MSTIFISHSSKDNAWAERIRDWLQGRADKQQPDYVFAPEVCPGGALRVGSGSADPAELIRHLRAVSDPLLGELQDGDDRGASCRPGGSWGPPRPPALRVPRHHRRPAATGRMGAAGTLPGPLPPDR